mmetsp:Transcript_49490/g.132434  ORF Transcript_49490/g.132434 Transcript_49490/m.132434 type:complete len:220 (-) Transcript_49490:165-824(-)
MLQADGRKRPRCVRELLRLEEPDLRVLSGDVTQRLEELGIYIPAFSEGPERVGDLLRFHLAGVPGKLQRKAVEDEQVATLERRKRPSDGGKALHLVLAVPALQDVGRDAGEEVRRAQGQLGVCPQEVRQLVGLELAQSSRTDVSNGHEQWLVAHLEGCARPVHDAHALHWHLVLNLVGRGLGKAAEAVARNVVDDGQEERLHRRVLPHVLQLSVRRARS